MSTLAAIAVSELSETLTPDGPAGRARVTVPVAVVPPFTVAGEIARLLIAPCKPEVTVSGLVCDTPR